MKGGEETASSVRLDSADATGYRVLDLETGAFDLARQVAIDEGRSPVSP